MMREVVKKYTIDCRVTVNIVLVRSGEVEFAKQMPDECN